MAFTWLTGFTVDGSVGIGVGSNPAKQLEILYPSYIDKDTVEGAIRLVGQSNSENAGDIPSGGIGIEFYNKWQGGLPYSTGRISARASQSFDGGLQFDVSQNTAAGQTNFITAMTILDNSAVGIGTTAPIAQLHVKGSGNSGDPVMLSENTLSSVFVHTIEAMSPNITAGQNNLIVIGKLGTTKNAGYIGYKYSAAGSNANVLTLGHWGSDNLMNITGDGKVGIGTIDPSASLTVIAPDLTVNPAINIRQTNASTQGWDIDVENNSYGRLDISGVGAGNVKVQAMSFMKASGKVGIGTETPSNKLDVYGTIDAYSNINSIGISKSDTSENSTVIKATGTYQDDWGNPSSWQADDGSYTINSVNAPDGTTTGTSMTFAGTSYDLYKQINPGSGGALVDGEEYKMTVWLKLGTATNFVMQPNNGAWSTLVGRSFTSEDGLNTSTWTQVTHKFTYSSGGRSYINFHIGGNTGGPTQTAGTVYTWNWQFLKVEADEFYIPNIKLDGIEGNSSYINSGNVGIGILDPKAMLHVGELSGGDGTAQERVRLTGDYTSTGSGALLSFTNQHNSGTYPNTGEYNLGGVVAWDYRSDWGGAIGLQTAPNTSEGGTLTTRLEINPEGAIKFNAYSAALNTGTPTYLLGVDASGNVYKTGDGAATVGPYLPLAGGTLSGDLTISTTGHSYLNINAENTGGSEAGINFQVGGATKWETYTAANDGNYSIWSAGNGIKFSITSAGAATFANTINSGTITSTGYVDASGGFRVPYIPASDAPIITLQGAANNYGIFYRESTPDSIVFKYAGVTKHIFSGDGSFSHIGKGTSAATVAADGVSTLVTKSYVDGLLTGTPLYKGTWNAATNSPDLTLAANKVLGNYYIVDTAGTSAPNGAATEPDSWNVGDWAIFSDITPGAGTDLWQKIDNTSVISGSGTGGKLTKWAGAANANSETLTDSIISENLSTVTIDNNPGNLIVTGSVNAAEFDLPSSGSLDWANGDARIQEGLVSNYSLSFQTYTGSALTTKMFIASSGNVGIGNTAPTYKLVLGTTGTLSDSIKMGTFNVAKDTRQYIGYARNDTGLFESSGNGDTPSTVLSGVAGIRIVNTEGTITSTQADNSVQLLTHIYNGGSMVALHANYDGNIGIGTTTPQRPLHIEGASGSQLLVTGANDAVGSTAGILLRAEGGESDSALRAKGGIFFERIAGSFGNGKLILAVNSSANNDTVAAADAAITISENKNVGIGTTSPVSHSVNRRTLIISDTTDGANMEIWGSAGGKSLLQSVSGETYLGNLVKGTGSGITHLIYGDGSTGMQLLANGSVKLNQYGVGFLQTDASGNVTASGSTVLPGGPYLPLSAGSSNSLTGALYINNVSGDKKISFARTGGNSFSIEHDTGQLYFYNSTTGLPALNLKNNGNVLINNGNVGIGTTTPSNKLDVEGTIDAYSNINSIGIIKSDTAVSSSSIQASGTYLSGGDWGQPTWNTSAGSYTLNNATAPDGTTTATLMTFTVGTGSNWDLYKAIGGAVDGGIYKVTVWMKLGTATNFVITPNNSQSWDTSESRSFDAEDGLNTTTWTQVSHEFVYDQGTATNINVHIGAASGSTAQPQTAGTVYSWGWEILKVVDGEFDVPNIKLDGITGNVSYINSGNFGVGTDTPSKKFHVKESTTAAYAAYIENTVAGGDFLAMVGDAGDNVFQFESGGTGGEAYMKMLSDGLVKNVFNANGDSYFSGNLGLGTTGPTSKLDIRQTGGTQLSITSGDSSGSADIRINLTSSGDYRGRGIFYKNSGDTNKWFSGVPYTGGAYQIGYHTSQPEYKANAKISLLSNGFVGVGESSPAAKLHVKYGESGATRWLSNESLIVESNGTNTLNFLSTSTAENYIMMSNPTSATAGYISFANSTTSWGINGSRVNVTGVMGIGNTTTPNYRLELGSSGALIDSIKMGTYDVAKDTRQYIGYTRDDTGLFETGSSGNTPSTVLGGVSGIRISNTAGSLSSAYADNSVQLLTHTYNGGSFVALHANYNGKVGIMDTTPSYELDVNGTIRATGDVIAYSDARVKDNIETIENALDKVTQLRGVSYTRNDVEDKTIKIGVIAQEVLEVLPEVVQQDDEGKYSVAYGNMVGLLIEAIKEQDKKIERLEGLVELMLKNK